MSLFSKKISSFLGIDLGTESIKFVELDKFSGRPRLITYGLVEVESNVPHDDKKESQEKVARVLKELLNRAKARSRSAVAALPNFSVFSSLITLPALSERELSAAVQWEAKKFIPMPLENVVLDWKIIKEEKPLAGSAAGLTSQPASNITQDANSQKKVQESKDAIKVLLTAAPKYLIERYVTVFKMAGLALLSLETESFALSRSLVGNDLSVVLIADVGSLTTDLTVVEGGVPVLSRSIDIGGKTITNAIAGSLGIDVGRAEQFKRDVGIGRSGNIGESDGVSRIIHQSFAAVVNEMKYALNLYQNQGMSRVEKVLLTGGSAWLPSLQEFLTSSLGIKAFIANPWARISYPRDLAAALETIAPRMAIAIGLAMREIE
jgi:type IV pilus assembly protein PilM